MDISGMGVCVGLGCTKKNRCCLVRLFQDEKHHPIRPDSSNSGDCLDSRTQLWLAAVAPTADSQRRLYVLLIVGVRVLRVRTTTLLGYQSERSPRLNLTMCQIMRQFQSKLMPANKKPGIFQKPSSQKNNTVRPTSTTLPTTKNISVPNSKSRDVLLLLFIVI